ncbi:MAG TPA: MarR family transcriptional regulator [Sphingobacteriaceae bacterium]
MDLIRELEELALSTRLKRLHERLAADVSRIYKECDLDFEAKWFPILELLRRKQNMSIVEISQALQLSHPAVVQFADQLIQKGFITPTSDPHDARRRLLNLSEAGKSLLQKLAPVLRSIKDENKKWLQEADANLLRILDQLEHGLNTTSMYNRIRASLNQDNL